MATPIAVLLCSMVALPKIQAAWSLAFVRLQPQFSGQQPPFEEWQTNAAPYWEDLPVTTTTETPSYQPPGATKPPGQSGDGVVQFYAGGIYRPRKIAPIRDIYGLGGGSGGTVYGENSGGIGHIFGGGFSPRAGRLYGGDVFGGGGGGGGYIGSGLGIGFPARASYGYVAPTNKTNDVKSVPQFSLLANYGKGWKSNHFKGGDRHVGDYNGGAYFGGANDYEENSGGGVIYNKGGYENTFYNYPRQFGGGGGNYIRDGYGGGDDGGGYSDGGFGIGHGSGGGYKASVVPSYSNNGDGNGASYSGGNGANYGGGNGGGYK